MFYRLLAVRQGHVDNLRVFLRVALGVGRAYHLAKAQSFYNLIAVA